MTDGHRGDKVGGSVHARVDRWLRLDCFLRLLLAGGSVWTSKLLEPLILVGSLVGEATSFFVFKLWRECLEARPTEHVNFVRLPFDVCLQRFIHDGVASFRLLTSDADLIAKPCRLALLVLGDLLLGQVDLANEFFSVHLRFVVIVVKVLLLRVLEALCLIIASGPLVAKNRLSCKHRRDGVVSM